MLTIMSFMESCNISTLPTVSDVNENLETFFNTIQNESVIESIITKVKQVLGKIKEILYKIKDHFSKKFAPNNFDRYDLHIIKARMVNNAFLRKFRTTAHSWNTGYLNALPDMVEKLNTVRVSLPDGSKIDTSVYSIVDAIVSKINKLESGRYDDIKLVDMTIEYKEEIDSAVRRIFSVHDISEIPEKVKSRNTFTKTYTTREIEDMLEDIDYTDETIRQITRSYSSLIEDIKQAESSISHIKDNEIKNGSGYVKVIQDLMYMLQYKVQVINDIEHIHIRCLQDRSNEYHRILREFIRV